MSKDTQHGGPRPGAGRPRKGEKPRVGLSLSVSPAVLEAARELREAEVRVNDMVGEMITRCASEGLAPIPGADFTIERTETCYRIKIPCVRIK